MKRLFDLSGKIKRPEGADHIAFLRHPQRRVDRLIDRFCRHRLKSHFLHLAGGNLKKLKSGAKVQAVWNDEKKGHMLDIKYFELV